MLVVLQECRRTWASSSSTALALNLPLVQSLVNELTLSLVLFLSDVHASHLAAAIDVVPIAAAHSAVQGAPRRICSRMSCEFSRVLNALPVQGSGAELKLCSSC